MSRFLLTTTAAVGIAVLSLAAVGTAIASPGKGGCGWRSPLSAEERTAQHAEMFRILDANGDGTVSAEEWTNRAQNPAWVQFHETRRQAHDAAMLRALDTNGDGAISAEEWAAKADRMTRRDGPRGPGGAAPQ